ncbi:MAG: Spy/CpxP family protein refolding chaperone [Candidatus Eisenbacteria bacterium]|uniref:Spy/CpxP family protein refolding chaperone n=1 Tax=Eiseniibacteriota bacterium TaxID=2212470 RepID=A0A933W9E1_UNCEI|nr:Spy/CpxP family protein refolding chaperone [Candidatus Eisenbacteria bacterium]
MTKRSMLSLSAMAALLVAGAAVAADTPAPKPEAPADREVHRVVIQTDADDVGGEFDELAWLEDDGDFFTGDDEGAGGPEVRREVIVHRVGPGAGAGPHAGMGMGMGHGAGGPGGPGGEQCGPGCTHENCGPGMGAGHGKGMGMGPGMGIRGHGGPGGPGMGRGMRHPGMMFAMLDLSDAQKAKMRDIHERAARTQIQARADMQIAQMDMRKLMRADKPDQAAINAQIDKMAQMRASMQKTRVATMLEARAQLTPDQLKKMQEMREKGPMMMHGGMGAGMGHGGMGGAHAAPPAPAKPRVK